MIFMIVISYSVSSNNLKRDLIRPSLFSSRPLCPFLLKFAPLFCYLSLCVPVSASEFCYLSVFFVSIDYSLPSSPTCLLSHIPSILSRFFFLPGPFPFPSPALPPQLKFDWIHSQSVPHVTPPPSFSTFSLTPNPPPFSLFITAVMSVRNIDESGRRLFQSLASSHIESSHRSIFSLLCLAPSLHPHPSLWISVSESGTEML